MPQHDSTTGDLRDHAKQQIQAGQLDAAQITLRSLLKSSPQYLPAWLELAHVLVQQGHWKSSSEPLLQATRYLPKHAPAVLQLVQQLMGRGEIIAARRCLDFLAQAPQPPAELLLAQAHLRFLLGEIAVAKDFIERALRAGADAPDDHHMHAMLLQFSGDIGGACEVLEQCVERWPHYGDAAMVLVNLRRQTVKANRLAYVEEQLGKRVGGKPSRDEKFVYAEFEYARFKILDDLGRCDEAWPALLRCNRCMQELNPYDAKGEAAMADALIEMPVPRMATEGVEHPEGPIPIFIVGMPRSGTTLLERMLSGHSRVASAGELIDFWQHLHWVTDIRPNKTDGLLQVIKRSDRVNFREVGTRYLRQTQWRAGNCDFYIDKLPANIQMVSFIRRALPHALILHMMRDPMDTCFSNFKAMFGNVSPYSYDLEALAHYYSQYAKVMRHWMVHLPGAMLNVRYADLVGDTETVMRQVLTYCNLEVEEACLYPERNRQPVATPSSAQVREPVHQRGVGQWRRYEAQLQPLKHALGELAEGV